MFVIEISSHRVDGEPKGKPSFYLEIEPGKRAQLQSRDLTPHSLSNLFSEDAARVLYRLSLNKSLTQEEGLAIVLEEMPKFLSGPNAGKGTHQARIFGTTNWKG